MGSQKQVWGPVCGGRAPETPELAIPSFVVLTLERGTCFHLQNYFKDEIAIPKNPKCNETKDQNKCPLVA